MIVEIVVQVTCEHNTQWLVYEPDQFLPPIAVLLSPTPQLTPSKPP